ncbi:hypothetical protein [Maribellus sp. YY47]|uniref:hypothetical protein n=1 Tax=Maribellus sp. YY47 TaxID=2929486 RepID=UPI0020013AC5|nr:hypothetical protein [Maribellus sp. YY47]MCK3684163.1 hypothetical protein [Maribellus sp. YY47]
MKKLIVFAIIVMALASMSFSTESAGHKNLIGNWKYKVTTAPPGLDSGWIKISEKEGKLVGQIEAVDGTKMEMKNISFEKEELKFGVYVEYDYVSIKAKVKGKELTGTVASPEGEMQITAQKEVKAASK